MCGYCGCSHDESHHPHRVHDSKIIEIEKDILALNQRFADQNRIFFKKNKVATINLVSSPGSGKTALLVRTIEALKSKVKISVIEGDQQTDLDKARIAKTGVPVTQINTGKACHLDAHHISHAIEDISLKNDLLFIENVGNLVCPALFDLGEACKVVILSVTEGDDKPLKYPHMLDQSKLMIINKIDLLPYVTFDVGKCIDFARRINPHIEVLQLSATKGQGLTQWCDWLAKEKQHFM